VKAQRDYQGMTMCLATNHRRETMSLHGNPRNRNRHFERRPKSYKMARSSNKTSYQGTETTPRVMPTLATKAARAASFSASSVKSSTCSIKLTRPSTAPEILGRHRQGTLVTAKSSYVYLDEPETLNKGRPVSGSGAKPTTLPPR
jgi:hypothetical protein